MEHWISDFSDHVPIYAQIVQKFKERVACGSLKPGERLPSIRDLAIALRVNPNTVMRAYQELERGRLIKSQRGLGFFVADNDTAEGIRSGIAASAAQSFVSEMRRIGLSDERILQILHDHLKERGNGHE